MLTKSDFIKYIQCVKYLWLYKNRKDLLPKEVDANLQRMFDDGYEVESYANKLFPDGVDSGDENIPAAISKTKKLISAKTKTIFQPTVTGRNLFCRADVIRFNRKNSEWDIYEIKNSTEVKDIHFDDVAFQKMAFEEAGYAIGKTYLIHINNSYVRKGELDLKKLFTVEDISQDVSILEKAIKKQAKSSFDTLKLKKEPSVRILKQCGSPYECAFVDYCYKNIPENSIYSIARGLSEAKLNRLLDEGILEIKNIPEGVITSARGLKHYRAVKTRQVHIEKKNIKKELENLKYPLYFLDYETNSPAIPMFDGYKPYQRMTFQYSLHIKESKNSKPEHFEYLARGFEDPSPKLAESLGKIIGSKGSVIAWNKSFEKGCNKEMAERYPKYAEFFESVNHRMYDLMDSFKKGYYVHHDFYGSASLKKVLPVLIPELSYKKLNIQEGGTASNTWLEMIGPNMDNKQKDKTYKDLLDYCQLDTLAMVEILERLERI